MVATPYEPGQILAWQAEVADPEIPVLTITDLGIVRGVDCRDGVTVSLTPTSPATISSGFPLAALAAATDRPERVIVWHWASPPVVMKFAEIVVREETDAKVVETVRELAAGCGKNPIVVKDHPTAWGYVANRVYAAMIVEASRVVAEGIASHDEVNQLMVDCFGWPVGPFGMVKGAQTGWSE